MKFSNDLVEAIGTVSQTATIDTIMYDALIRHKAEPSFIRKVAKAPVARGGKNFLDSLFHASKKYEGNPYPKLMELLTDPGLYKAKKKHHKSKKVAEQFQMEKMQMNKPGPKQKWTKKSLDRFAALSFLFSVCLSHFLRFVLFVICFLFLFP